jgi:undecaprenyl-diphosphatase
MAAHLFLSEEKIMSGLEMWMFGDWLPVLAQAATPEAVQSMAPEMVPGAATETSLVIKLVEAVVLGLVQGITEFLPISSTAHLVIFRDVFHWSDWSKTAINGIQLGSVFAVFIYFWKDITTIIGGALAAFQAKDWRREEWKILVGIALGTIPTLGLGFLMKKVLKIDIESPQVIAIMSIVMALLLGLAEKIGSRQRKFGQLQVADGVLVGLAQAIALIPGASRSGSTLTAGLFLGLERQTAARFSFLLGIPTLTIATLAETKDAIHEKAMLFPMIVGLISSFAFSYFAIAWLLKFLQTNTNWVFVWYRLAFGTALLAAIAAGTLAAG